MLVGGATAERRDGRALLTRYNICAIIPPTTLALAIIIGELSYGLLILYALAMGTLSAFALPTRDAMASYSPYDNVAAQDYPHIFALGGLTDPRVTYWEPAKWVAKMRALKTDNNLLLLKTNMEAGHGGASGRFEQLEETALIYAFMNRKPKRAEATLNPIKMK